MEPNTEKKPTRRQMAANTRTSREQESRENSPIHEEVVDFSEQGPLPSIKARPGMDQRWVRIRKGSEMDAQNMGKAVRHGWRPRAPDSVPEHLQFMLAQREGLGGCIGTHDMVLMERSEKIGAQQRAMLRDARRGIEKAVKNKLHEDFKGAREQGFSAPDNEGSTTRIERGRKPTIQDD